MESESLKVTALIISNGFGLCAGRRTSWKPNEFGKMVKLQEAENQIVIDYEVYDRRPSDSDYRNASRNAGTRAAYPHQRASLLDRVRIA